jgi:hypothetical protein
MERIYTNKLLSYLPIFVTNDWLHMIRSVQNIEKFDLTSSPSMSNLQQQMVHLKEHIISLDELVQNFNHISSISQPPLASISDDQCCLRTYCTHNSSLFQSAALIESPSSSSWSSLDIDTHLIPSLPGFIRNPVTNFIMPIGPTETEMESSFFSTDGNMSSDEELRTPSKYLRRSLSFQPSKTRTGPRVVKRADVLWMYPAAAIKSKPNSLFSSVSETVDELEFEPKVKRTNSCDIDFPVKKFQDPLLNKFIKKPKKTVLKQVKGLKRMEHVACFFFDRN